MHITKISDVVIVHPVGELNIARVTDLEQVFFDLVRQGSHKILLDMTLVDHLHYMNVMRLVQIAQILRKHQGDLRLVGLNESNGYIIKFTGGQNVLKCFPSLSSGILSFYNPWSEESVAVH